MRIINNYNKCLLFVILCFIIRAPTFSAKFTYDPLDFTISARYVKPLKVEFDEPVMFLGYFLETESLNGDNGLDKAFGVTISGEPSDKVILSINPTITMTNTLKNKNITIKQSLRDTTLNIGSNGSISTKIIFTSDDTIPSDGYGSYSGTTTITATLN